MTEPTPNLVLEAGASENSLSPGGGTAAGDLKTKTIADIVAKLGSLGIDDINGFKKSIAQIGHEADSIGDKQGKNAASIKSGNAYAAVKNMVKEDLATIFGAGEQPLSEDAMDKTALLFEAALETRINLELQRLEEENETALVEQQERLVEQMTERLDQYMTYMAEEFFRENQIAIESSRKVDLAEAVINTVRNMLAENNIEVSDEQVDVVAGLEAQVEDLKSQLNEALTEKFAIEAAKTTEARKAVFATVSEGMTDLDRDRLAMLAESVDYTTDEEFSAKVAMLKENFFNAAPAAADTGLLLEEVDVDNGMAAAAPTREAADPRVEAVRRALGRQSR